LTGQLKNSLHTWKKNNDVAVAGPKIISPNGELQESCREFITPKVIFYRRTWLGRFGFAQDAVQENLMLKWDHETVRDVDWIMGSSMLVRKKAIDEIGSMDERFFMYMEDMDWCRRFWEKGWKVCYVPQSEMVHYYQRMSGRQNGIYILAGNKLARIHLVSGIKYFWKYLWKQRTMTTK
jgi:GT2 family glycosyltransferase